ATGATSSSPWSTSTRGTPRSAGCSSTRNASACRTTSGSRCTTCWAAHASCGGGDITTSGSTRARRRRTSCTCGAGPGPSGTSTTTSEAQGKDRPMNAPVPQLALETAEVDTSQDPQWFRDAVIYQLNVKAFNDTNGDGIGDFKGVTAKLDYVKELGVNTIWLMPFYPSPLRDDGYDISEYKHVKAEDRKSVV